MPQPHITSQSQKFPHKLFFIHLIKFLRHFPDDLGMLHVVVHVWRDVAFAARAVHKELYQVEQGRVTVLLVGLNPVIHYRLEIDTWPNARGDLYSCVTSPIIIRAHVERGYISYVQ